jgi:hypothetical protein
LNKAVGSFLQDLQDWGNILSEIGEAERTRVSFSFTQQMKELERLGFSVFAAKQIQQIQGSNDVMVFPLAALRVVRKTNSSIQTISPDNIRAAAEQLRTTDHTSDEIS